MGADSKMSRHLPPLWPPRLRSAADDAESEGDALAVSPLIARMRASSAAERAGEPLGTISSGTCPVTR